MTATTKTALVTGSSGGIGQEVCHRLKKDGINVIGLVHSKSAEPPPWPEYICDLSQIEKIEKTLSNICEENGVCPDILINNAGIYQAKPWDQISPEEFSLTLTINTQAPFVLLRFWAQKLIEEKKEGVAVNISSVSGQIGSLDPSYAASKAGLNAITKSMAKALAPHNIRVNAVAPGPVQTPMADDIPQEKQKEYKEKIPLGRFAQPSEIAALVCAMTGEEAGFMTGAIVAADGGLT